MSTVPSPQILPVRPFRERRRNAGRRRWNGKRRHDPQLTLVEPGSEVNPLRVTLWAILLSAVVVSAFLYF